MRGIPGMKVFCPADEDDLVLALPALLAEPGPWLRPLHRAPGRRAPRGALRGRPGRGARGRRRRRRSSPTALLFTEALDARSLLRAVGISARVLNLRTLAAARRGGRARGGPRAARLVVTVEDHFKTRRPRHDPRRAADAARPRRGTSCRSPSRRAGSARPSSPTCSSTRASPRTAIAQRILEEPRIGQDDRRRRRAHARRPRDHAVGRAVRPRPGLIPAGTQTLAKGPGQYVNGFAPKYLVKGRGARVWDVDGNQYLDLTMGVGPLVLGYAHPAVDEAIRSQLRGRHHVLAHAPARGGGRRGDPRALVPGAESVRFSKTGADVTSAAVRLARAFTGREQACSAAATTAGTTGTSAVTDRRTAASPSAVRGTSPTRSPTTTSRRREQALDDDTACVILEPMVFEAPRRASSRVLRPALRRARRAPRVRRDVDRLPHGAGRRAAGVRRDRRPRDVLEGGRQRHAPLRAGGPARRDELLDKDVFFFTTFGGEALSLAAAKATLDAGAPATRAGALAARAGGSATATTTIACALGLDWTRCVGLDARTMVTFDATAGDPLQLKSFVQQELIRRGVLWSGFHNLCAAHAHGDDEVAFLLEAYEEVLPLLKEARRRDGHASPRAARRPGRARVPQDHQLQHGRSRGRAREWLRLLSLAGRVAIVTGALGLLGRAARRGARGGRRVGRADRPRRRRVRPSRPRLPRPGVALGHGARRHRARERRRAARRDPHAPRPHRRARQQRGPRTTRFEDLALRPTASRFEHYPLEQFRRISTSTSPASSCAARSSARRWRAAAPAASSTSPRPTASSARTSRSTAARRHAGVLQVAGLPDHQGGGARLHPLPRGVLGPARRARQRPVPRAASRTARTTTS